MENLEIILRITNLSLELIKKLGLDGKKEVDMEQGQKRACLLEKSIYEGTCEIFDKTNEEFKLVTEGFPDYGVPTSKKIFFLDPLDGTVYYVRQKSSNPFHISTVISSLDYNPETSLFSSVNSAAIIDLITGETYSSNKNHPTLSSHYGICQTGSNEQHDSLWLTDFYFTQNAIMRNLFKNPKNDKWDAFEFLNTGSVALQSAKVACGEADTFINVIGPKGYELTAMYLIVKNAGGHVLDLRSGKELGQTLIEPNLRIPVVMSKDETLSRQIYEKIDNVNLVKKN